MKKIFIGLLLIGGLVKAQDPHFSQYHASPLTLNPAMTGYTNSDYRLSFNFRNQYWSVGRPFTTGTFSYDVNLPQNESGNWAFGVLGLYDRSSGGSYSNVHLGVSGAYHKILDEEGFSKLGLGFQASLATKKISIEGLSFANQFTSGGFNTNLPNNETFLTRSSTYLDFNTGLLYQYEGENTSFYAGASMYHVGRPNVSLKTDAVYKLPSRYTTHAGARLTVGDNSNELFLSGSFMYQAAATDKILGAAYGVNFSNDSRDLMMYMGSWYRFGDSFIPYVGVDFNNFQFGVSYDIINSDLKLASPKTGSFEISFNYMGHKQTNPYSNYKSKRIF